MGNVHINIASLLSDRVLSSNLRYTKTQALRYVYHTVLPREICYSSKVSGVCSLRISRDMNAGDEQCER